MSQDPAAVAESSARPGQRAGERVSFYLWTALALAAAVTTVVISWHAKGGTTDPTALPPGGARDERSASTRHARRTDPR
jgi:hypothetical protein